MKILHVIPSMAATYGGPSHALAQMQEVLKQNNIENNIAATQDDRDGVLTLSPSKTLFLFPRKFPGFYFYAPAMQTWLSRNLCSYDLIHIHSTFTFPAMIAGHYARALKIPYLIRPFGTLDKECMRRHFLRKKLYLETIERKNLNAAQYIHCTSESEKEDVDRLHLQTKTLVIPLGLFRPAHSLHKRPENDTAPFKILYLSRIDPKKGLEVLIEAIKELKKRRNDFLLLIAGSGRPAYVEKIKNSIRKKNLTGNVSFLGEVTGEQKKKTLEDADMFILPSKRENFGLAVAEAMDAGLPVVVSAEVAISGEIQRYGAGLVVLRTLGDIQRALNQLLDDPEKRYEMGRKGQELVREKFDLTKNLKKLIAVYQTMISAKKYADSRA